MCRLYPLLLTTAAGHHQICLDFTWACIGDGITRGVTGSRVPKERVDGFQTRLGRCSPLVRRLAEDLREARHVHLHLQSRWTVRIHS